MGKERARRTVRRAEERRAGCATADGEHGGMHHVLDEGPREHDAAVEVRGCQSVGISVTSRFGVLLFALVVLGNLVGGSPPVCEVASARHCDVGAISGLVANLVVARGLVGVLVHDHRRVQRVAPRDAHVLVRLLVVDKEVAGVLPVTGGLGLRRHHDVELADLARPREHLD